MARRPRKPGEPRDAIAELVSLKNATRPRAMLEATSAPQTPEAETRRYRDVLDVAVSLTSTLDLKVILDAVVDGIIRVTRCERGFVILRDADGDLEMFTGRSREGTPWDQASAQEISHTVVDRVIATHAMFVGSDVEKIDDLRVQESIVAHRIRSVVCLPLIDKEQLVGVIYADSSFVIPPFDERDREMLHVFGAQAAVAVARARHHGEVLERGELLEEQNRQLRQQLGQNVIMSRMVIRDQRMLNVFAVVEKVASRGMSSLLIHGESGTGKELLSRAFHDLGPRRGGPFVAFNAAALSPTLVESALFGHRKGAFTGADFEKPGYFEVANGGTLFLDEIGEMSLELQSKLLRALQEKKIERMSEEGHERDVDVNVVAATNKDLARAVKERTFREDLYFRLNRAEVYVPPLRDRKDDILPLAEHFLKKAAETRHQPLPRLSREARAFLLSHAWPGNVRELENMMDWAVTFQDENGIVSSDVLASKLRGAGARPALAAEANGSLRQMMERYEERAIRDALTRNENNVSATAKELGLSRQMLHEKIKKYAIATRET